MKLQTSARWRGLAAGLLLAIGLFVLAMIWHAPHSDPAWAGPGLFLFPGAYLLRSWWRLRRRMRVADYQASAIARALR